MKICKTCDRMKALDEYYYNRSCKDARETSCKECRKKSIYSKERKRGRHYSKKGKCAWCGERRSATLANICSVCIELSKPRFDREAQLIRGIYVKTKV